VLRRDGRLARAPVEGAPAKGHAMGMLRPDPLAPVDLPVDVIVVLEQQERAGEAERAEGAL
jgi:hypothetical protein